MMSVDQERAQTSESCCPEAVAVAPQSTTGNESPVASLAGESTTTTSTGGSKKSTRSSKQRQQTAAAAAPSTKTKQSPATNHSQRFNNKNRYNINTSNGGSRFLEQLEPDLPVTTVGSDVSNKSGCNRKKLAGGAGGSSVKASLNHLLNFKYESTTTRGDDYYEYERMNKQFWSMKLNKSSCFSKEQFLQANCQFVVKNTGDYSVNLCDPDRLVDWDLVEQVQIETTTSSSSGVSCPICLYEPVAAKMAKCGHVYCWPCLLHYLSLSDKAWRKCPICYEPIYKRDLKSVSVVTHTAEYKCGDRVDMTLMFKHKSRLNCITLPCDVLAKFEHADYSKLFEESADYSQCQKFLKLHSRSAEYINEAIVKREKSELTRQAEMDKDQPEVCFVSEALVLLQERESQLKAEIELDNSRSARKREKSIDAKEETSTSNKSQQHQSSSDMVFFYQASDGQRVFISGLNQRCLVAEYGSNLSERAPRHISSARIVASESHFMTEENRRSRYKYLSHLPLHSEFRLVELDLSDYLSEATLSQFREEIDERRHMRARKEMREKQSIDKAQARAAAASHQYDYYNFIQTTTATATAANLSDLNEFPEALSSSPPASSSASLVSGASSGGGIADTGIINAAATATAQSASSQVSFAQMLKQDDFGGSSHQQKIINEMGAWPSLDDSSTTTAAAAPPIASTAKTSGWLSMMKQQELQEPIRRTKYQNAPTPWGNTNNNSSSLSATSTTTTTTGTASHRRGEESDEGDNGSGDVMPAPHYKQSFFSAIDQSLRLIESRKNQLLEETKTTAESGGVGVGSSNNNKTNKKKKKTRQLLFSTS